MEKKFERAKSDLIKIVLFGPESTGKSTLARQLAEHYDTVFVPEYSRIFAEMQMLRNQPLTKENVMEIANGQLKLEKEWTPKACNILFCDTDLLETKVYSEMYYNGYSPPQLEDFAYQKTCDLYLLTYIDMPWVADNIRDKPEERQEQFNIFENTLKKYHKPYEIIIGNETKRLTNAIQIIDNLLKNEH